MAKTSNKPIGPMPLYRVACTECDRTDFDGVESLPSDWEDVEKVQTFAESIETEPHCFNVGTFSVFDWMTHVGTCPDCS